MTTIEWTQRPGTRGETWNPVRARNRETGGLGHFCEHVSEGCRNCYAERLQPRFGNPIRYARQDRDKVEVFLDEAKLEAPLRWRKPRTVFVCSMTDLFGDWVEEDWLDRIFAVMALTPRHTYQVLTKRPERMQAYFADWETRARIEPFIWDFIDERVDPLDRRSDDLRATVSDEWPLPNVWLGVSVEDQATADARIPPLLETPAAVRFVSYEPALGPVDFTAIRPPDRYEINALRGMDFDQGLPCARLDWVIAGGESGPNARPADPDWFRDAAMQCALARVPFFFKQWGEWVSVSEQEGAGRHFHFPDGATMRRIGKKAGGRLLDGREYNEWPR